MTEIYVRNLDPDLPAVSVAFPAATPHNAQKM